MKIACAMAVLLISTNVFSAQSPAQPAKVQNVRFDMYGTKVVINYDLLGDHSAKYKVQLILRRQSDPSYVYFPKALSGDIGTGRFAGQKKQIVWAISQEFPEGLQGSDFYFVVQAEEVGQAPNSQILTWIGSGVAVLAAAATYLILTNYKAGSNGPSSSGFPSPPGRP